jgi:hypothetical protein
MKYVVILISGLLLHGGTALAQEAADTSALILAADTPTIEEFAGAFEAYDVEIIETQLNEHDVKAVSEAMKAARERG